MANNMSADETFKFLDLYQAENCLWNPKNKYHKNKNVVNDAWNRIADTMGVPVHELKKKKENLLTTFRSNLKKTKASIKSGAGAEDVYRPVWIFYDVMAAFLMDVYEPASIMNSEDKTQPDEEASPSKIQASDIPPEPKIGNDDGTEVSATPQKNPSTQAQKRRAFNPPELQEASKKMNTALTTLNNVLTSKQSPKEEDECDLFCKMLAKQIKEYPKIEREEIMYELHGIMMNRRRRYNSMMKGRSYTVSSPSQVILSRPSTSNSVHLSSPSPNYGINSPYSVQSEPQNTGYQQSEVVNIISQDIIQPQTSRQLYENFENFVDDNTEKY